MQLYEVELEYKDIKYQKWEKPPLPKRDFYRVAVHPGWGSDPIMRAVDSACRMMIGPEKSREGYRVLVRSVALIGDVGVEVPECEGAEE